VRRDQVTSHLVRGFGCLSCADHVSGRYSHSLSDQPVADRRPRQQIARVVVIILGWISLLKYIAVVLGHCLQNARRIPGFFFRSRSGCYLTQRPEPVVHIPVDLILGQP